MPGVRSSSRSISTRRALPTTPRSSRPKPRALRRKSRRSTCCSNASRPASTWSAPSAAAGAPTSCRRPGSSTACRKPPTRRSDPPSPQRARDAVNTGVMKHGFALSRQSAEFRSAVRRFEQGLFEKAGEQVVAILKDDPHHLPSLRLLRLIERRLWPKPAAPPLLVWQFPPDKAFERGWLRMLLGDAVAGEQIDNTWSFLAPSM